MSNQFKFNKEELEQLNQMGDEALNQVQALPEDATIQALDVCSVVRKVLPILTIIRDIVCNLKFIPGLKQACEVLERIIPVLENLCPDQR